MDKRKIMLVALGVTDEWNPLETFKRLLVDVPLARIVGFGIPMELSRDVVKDWDTTARATLGLYGWRGTSFEMHDWTIGETYLKLRDAMDRGPFSPLLFPPDQSLSNEAAVVVAKGDGTKLPPLIVCSEYNFADGLQPEMTVLPFATDAANDGTLAVFMSQDVDIPKLVEVLKTLQTEAHFIDPIANSRKSKGRQHAHIEEVEL